MAVPTTKNRSASMFGPGDRCRSIILLLAFASAACSCGGKDAISPIEVEKQAFADLRAEIRRAIDDPEREIKAIAIIDGLVDELTSLRNRMVERKKRTRQLNANYDASRADFDDLFEDAARAIRSNQQRITEKHRALLAVTTAAERSAIAKARTRSMAAAMQTLQAI